MSEVDDRYAALMKKRTIRRKSDGELQFDEIPPFGLLNWLDTTFAILLLASSRYIAPDWESAPLVVGVTHLVRSWSASKQVDVMNTVTSIVDVVYLIMEIIRFADDIAIIEAYDGAEGQTDLDLGLRCLVLLIGFLISVGKGWGKQLRCLNNCDQVSR